MPVTRRDFLKLTGASTAGAFLGGLSFLTELVYSGFLFRSPVGIVTYFD